MRGKLIGAGIVTLVVYSKHLVQSAHDGWPEFAGVLTAALVVFGAAFGLIWAISAAWTKLTGKTE